MGEISKRDSEMVVNIFEIAANAGIIGAATVTLKDNPANVAILTTAVTGLIGLSAAPHKERISELIRAIFKRLSCSSNEVKERFAAHSRSESGERIWEIAWKQAANELDCEKREQLASLLMNSLSSDKLQEHQTRWLLKILGELDSVQIIILQSYALSSRELADFKQQHELVFSDEERPIEPKYPYSGLDMIHFLRQSPHTREEEIRRQKATDERSKAYEEFQKRLPSLQKDFQIKRENHALFQSRKHRLIEMGLLGLDERDFDARKLEKLSMALTPLGAALLKIINVVDYEIWAKGEQVNTTDAVSYALWAIERNSQKEMRERMQALRQSS